MIVATGLRKSYGDFEAVKGIDVEVRKGEAFGFLGPNGAGKSSTMRMIAAVQPGHPSGSLRILGMDPATQGSQIRARIGVCPQEDNLDNELRVGENLIVYGRYFGLSRAESTRRTEELLDFVQLSEKAGAKVEDLSGGMKRRLTIARSLINEPDLLLLDEPTTGLDPQARHQLWDRLFRLKQQGVTLVLTTHYMDEAEQLCDRLVVMDKGVIVAHGSPAELIAQHSTREVVELRFGVGEHEAMEAKVADLADRVEVLPDRLLLYTDEGEDAATAVHERGLRPLSSLVRRVDPRGRLPPAHRTEPGRVSVLAPRLTDYWLTVWRRTWKGTAVTSFVIPFLTLTGMGVGLGTFVDDNTDAQDAALGGLTLPRLHRTGPARGDRDADRDRGDDLPDHERVQVAPLLLLDGRQPARGE